MPDIQSALKSALSKTLTEWDDDEGTNVPVPSVQPVSISVPQPSQNIQGIPMTNTTGHRFPIKNNVTRTTFNYVRDNPGSTRKEILIALEHLGYNESSTSSLLSQLRKNKLIHDTNGLYYADATEYSPIKNVKKAAPAPVEVRQKRKYTKRSEGIGALLKTKLENMATPSQDALDAAAYAMGGQHRIDKPFLTKLVRTKSPESIVDNMTVLQARELYDYLKKIFNA